jgi:hypothetical protein
LPKIVTTGVSAATSARMFGSESARLLRWRVEPKAASLAVFQAIDLAAAKKSASLGFEPGQPPRDLDLVREGNDQALALRAVA